MNNMATSMDCVFGVDGGNTKTDYFLFGLDGGLIEHFRDGTCSHERLGFEKAEEILHKNINRLLTNNNRTVENVKW